jgi:hypothetical protein
VYGLEYSSGFTTYLLGFIIAIAVFIIGVNLVYELYKHDSGALEYGFIFTGLASGFLCTYWVYRGYKSAGLKPRVSDLIIVASLTSITLTLMLAFFQCNTLNIGAVEALERSWRTGVAVFLGTIGVDYIVAIIKYSIVYWLVFIAITFLIAGLRMKIEQGTYYYIAAGFMGGFIGGLVGSSGITSRLGKTIASTLFVLVSMYFTSYITESNRIYCSECRPYLETWNIALTASAIIGVATATLYHIVKK